MVVNPFDNVPEEHIFHFRDGKKAHNLVDLRNVIEKMPLDEFNHHVDEFNNDFANWVEFVYKNPDLANDLRKVTSRREILEILDVELGKYSGESSLNEQVEDKQEKQEEKGEEEYKKKKKEKEEVGTPVAVSEDDKSLDVSSDSGKKAEQSSLDSRKSLFEEPYKPSVPPQKIITHNGEEVHTVSTHAVHHFIVKEFVYGAVAGFILGLLLMGILINLGAFA